MGKIAEWTNKRKNHTPKPTKAKSIKRTFFWYLPLCVAVAYLGAYGIGWVFNELQNWYEITYSDVDYQTLVEETYSELDKLHEEDQWGKFSEMPVGAQMAYDGILTEESVSPETEKYVRIQYVKTVNGMTYYDVRAMGKFFSDNPWHRFVYGVLSYGQGILMISWVLLCVAVTGIIFYKRELEKPINVLMEASEKISDNCLDFEMKPVKRNELGQLCQSFEDMRQALYENNRELWHTLEERKRLNAAFSHDIRTPLAVLKGYQEMLQNYVPEGKFSKEQLMEMIESMGGQIARLESYTQKMSAVQKLEDIVPECTAVNVAEFAEQLWETGKLLAGNLEFELQPGKQTMPEEILLDKELVLEVFENLVSNGARYAKSKLLVKLGFAPKSEVEAAAVEETGEENALCITVEDDGPGFSEEALHRATDPFYGSEKDGRVHFGLGLYICKTICEKHGGKLALENKTEEKKVLGGRVIANFGVKSR